MFDDDDDYDKLMQEVRKLERGLDRLDDMAGEMEKTLVVIGKLREALRFNHDDGYKPLPHN